MKKQTKTKDQKPSGAGTPELRPSAKEQSDRFAEAMNAFWAGQYAKAKALFDEAVTGRDLSVSESALMYSRMCVRRMESPAVELKTPDDHYVYGISLINSGQYGEARPHLEAAAAASPASHYHYALAIAAGMLGAMQDAARSLGRAIDADPSVRSFARNDPDFAPLLEHALIREALAGNKARG